MDLGHFPYTFELTIVGSDKCLLKNHWFLYQKLTGDRGCISIRERLI